MPTASKTLTALWFQTKTLDSKARYIAMLGGTGGGKTWWGPLWLAVKIAEDIERGEGKGATYLILGPTAEMVRDMLVPVFKAHYKGTPLEGTYWKQSNIYDLPGGGQILFRSADKPERIEGHHVRAAWIDEPGQMKALVWPILQARTGFYQAPILFTGYPWDMGWYYHDIFKMWESGDPDYEVIQFRSIDNPSYPREEYERAKRTLPKWMFDMRHDGQFCKPFGLVYPTFGGPDMIIDPFEIPPDWPTYIGLDPGVFYGGLFLAWHDGVYYAYTEYYVEQVRSAKDHAKELLGRIRGHALKWIYDPSRITDVTDLKAHKDDKGNVIGPLVKGNNAVQAGIVTATGVINENRLKVMRGRCPNFVDQMEKYSFPVDPVTGNVAKENPIKRDDHLPDCFRYVVHTLEGISLKAKKTARSF